ncbi:MAG TPA: hypothetical protein VFD91_09445 [Mariniphaga sp.]|nr:hypothetical protein [Mariniphaga sp.]
MNNRYKTINLTYLEDISGGDICFQKELIEIFMNQIPVFLSNMKDYFRKRNYIKLAKEAHTAKSSVLIFMMEQVGKDLKRIQLLAENKEPDKIPNLINKVETTLTIAVSELEHCLKTENLPHTFH